MGLETAHKEAIKKICNKLLNLVLIMDNEFKCVYSNNTKLVPCDNSIISIFQKSIFLPLKEVHITMAMVKGCFYSVRIVPLDEELYMCEFFDVQALLSLMENTDLFDKLLPILNEIDFNTSALWRGYSTLHDRLESEERNEDLRCASAMERYLTSLNSVTKNVSEYVSMCFYNPKAQFAVNVAQLAIELVERCNTLLLKSGRYIDIVVEQQAIFIEAQVRHIVCAIVNAVQNALMYSPKDCIPYFSICKITENFKSFVRIQILNDNIMYVDQKHGERPGFNFDHQRLGYGIPIIKRFAEMNGGMYSFEEKDGKVRLLIDIPAVTDPNELKGIGVVNSSRYVHYETDIPDIVELKMAEVNDLFIS